MRATHGWNGSRRSLVASAVTAALAISGATCVGFALAHERQPPQPPSAVHGSNPSPAQEPPSRDALPPPAPALPKTVGPLLAESAPLALTIPAIGVRTPLQRLGQNADGSLEVPAPGPHYDEAGWYRHSPTPGALGPAIIAGHVDSVDGPSVFYQLGALRPNDKVLVRRTDGSVAVFAVDDVRRYPKARFPSQLVYGNTNHAALRLITCGGEFDKDGHYLDNIVVRASLIRTSGGAQPTTLDRGRLVASRPWSGSLRPGSANRDDLEVGSTWKRQAR